MAVGLIPVGNDAPFLDSSGNPLSGGLLYFYTAGSSTPQDTFTTSAGSVANANPVVLNSGGYPASGGSVVQIWGTVGVSYKAVLKTSAAVTVWTRDNLPIINDVTATASEWTTGPAPTYISATSFSLVGDQTSTFQVGRRLKTTNSGGTIYSLISASAYGAVTTVTVVNDSGTLDSGLSAVSYGLLSATNPAIPVQTDAGPIVSGSADRTKLLRFEVDGLTTATTRVVTVPDSDLTLPVVTTGTSASTFTFDGSGGTSASVTMTWQKVGNFVTLHLPLVQATTGTGSINFNAGTALPAALRPPSTIQYSHGYGYNGGTVLAAPSLIQILTTGVVVINRDGLGTAYTNTATGGTAGPSSFTWFVG